MFPSIGNNLYKEFKNPINKINFYIFEIYLVKDISIIKYILNNSPCLFKVGILKYKFFKSFMDKNLGISNYPEWSWRRKFNENIINQHLKNNVIVYKLNLNKYKIPEYIQMNFDDFMFDAKIIVKQIVFNNTEINDDVFDVFEQANSLWSIFDNDYKVDRTNFLKYLPFAKPGSMVHDAIYLNKLECNELIDQIPHWIFPIVGTISQSAPRLLLLLYHHPHILNGVKNGSIKLRFCILELLRLNCPVITMFRELAKDIKIENINYSKGTQFVFLNNPIMRDINYFKDSNKFIPKRWENINENDFIVLMFSQGPQKCPGREIAINLLEKYIGEIIKYSYKAVPSIDVNNIPQMINPFKIILTVKKINIYKFIAVIIIFVVIIIKFFLVYNEQYLNHTILYNLFFGSI